MPCYLLRQWAAAWVGPQPLLLPNSIPATACWSKMASSRRLTRLTGADASKSANQLVSRQSILGACISKALSHQPVQSYCGSVALFTTFSRHAVTVSYAGSGVQHQQTFACCKGDYLVNAKETTWSVLNIWGRCLARLEQSGIYQLKASAAIHLHMHCWSFVV